MFAIYSACVIMEPLDRICMISLKSWPRLPVKAVVKTTRTIEFRLVEAVRIPTYIFSLPFSTS
jgi:hypothetical protein